MEGRHSNYQLKTRQSPALEQCLLARYDCRLHQKLQSQQTSIMRHHHPLIDQSHVPIPTTLTSRHLARLALIPIVLAYLPLQHPPQRQVPDAEREYSSQDWREAPESSISPDQSSTVDRSLHKIL